MGCGCRKGVSGNQANRGICSEVQKDKKCSKCGLALVSKRIISNDLTGYIFVYKCLVCGIVSK